VHAKVLISFLGDDAIPNGRGGEHALLESPLGGSFSFRDHEVTLFADELKGIRRSLVCLNLNDSLGGVSEGKLSAKQEAGEAWEIMHELWDLGLESVSWK